MERVLVTGGAGFIGSHACKALRAQGYLPVTFDNLSTGWAEAVQFGPLAEGTLLDRARLDAVFAEHQPVAVMHFAALSLVGESMQNPGRYWHENVLGALNLIEAATAAGCLNFVFSSTCATYGDQDGVLLNEDTPQRPMNSYGGSKLAIEHMLRDFGASHGLRSVIFRYFNVAGSDPDGEIGECHVPETHLIPVMLQAIDGQRPALTVFGTDYDTRDGTCVRDYVHVSDLIDAHIGGLGHLLEGGGNEVFCLGTGSGFTVKEVIAAARRSTNKEVPVVMGARRSGDAVSLVCGSSRASERLGWTPRRSTLDMMISDAWRWHRRGPYAR